MAWSAPYPIANPIYDSVFKALLEDLEIARGMLSVLLGLRIDRLRLAAQESPLPGEIPGSLPRLLRLDFCAVIRDEQGRDAQVLIELQKTPFSGDAVMRFRHYLAQRYATLEEIMDGGGAARAEPLPVIPIYLLGFVTDERLPLATFVRRRYLDALTGCEVVLGPAAPPELLEKLTHDAYVVQIPRIRGLGGTRLERLLSVFDQSRKMAGDPHRLDYGDALEEIEDELLLQVVRKLHKIQADPEMQRIMTAEEVFELEQERLIERRTRDLTQRLEEEQRRREEAERRREEEQRRREEEQRRREEAESRIEQLLRLVERREDR